MLFGGINHTQVLNGHLHDFELVNNKWWALKFTEFRYNETIINQDPHKDTTNATSSKSKTNSQGTQIDSENVTPFEKRLL